MKQIQVAASPAFCRNWRLAMFFVSSIALSFLTAAVEEP
jgi:hypothetical protein